MTTINTIQDLARILQEQPTWAEALRALLLTQELLDLPARFDRFVEIQQETNEAQREFNQLTDRRLHALEARLDSIDGRLDNMQGRLGNLEGGQYERTARNKALARTWTVLGFRQPRVVLNQDGLTDPQLSRAIDHAIQEGRVAGHSYSGLFEADLVISARDNRHAVVEVSITADDDDISRAKERADILADVTGGEVTPMVVTSRLNPIQSAQAEAAGVSIFIVPYP